MIREGHLKINGSFFSRRYLIFQQKLREERKKIDISVFSTCRVWKRETDGNLLKEIGLLSLEISVYFQENRRVSILWIC